MHIEIVIYRVTASSYGTVSARARAHTHTHTHTHTFPLYKNL